MEKVTFSDPEVPIIGNCTGRPLTTTDSIKQELVSQVCDCVQWKRSVDYMVDAGVTEFIEVGPGTALSGMVKRIARGAKTTNVSGLDSILSLHRN
jgi:[acyl-carrier-protein] S-malonyltransferase